MSARWAATGEGRQYRAPSRQIGSWRKLERLGVMGLKIEGLPDPMNCQLRKPSGLRHRTQAPLPCVPRRRLKGLANDLGDIVVDLARRVGTRLVVETPPPQRPPRRPMSLFFAPSAACKTIRAHWARPSAVLRRDARLSSSRRSLCVKPSCPVDKILHANARRESRVYLSIRRWLQTLAPDGGEHDGGGEVGCELVAMRLQCLRWQSMRSMKLRSR